MGVFTQLVRSNGNERTFIKKFIHTVLAADDRITCDKTDAQIDEMFNQPPAGFYPEFTFTVGDLYTIRLRRFYEAGASATDGYRVYMKSLANAGEVSSGLIFRVQMAYTGNWVDRQYWLRVVSSEKAILIMLGNHDNIIPNTGAYSLRCIGYKDGDTIGFSAQKNDTGTSGMGSFFYIGDTRVTPVERLMYKNNVDARKAVVGKEKVMKDSSSYKHSVTNALCDVSMIPSFLQKEIKAGDEHYFVVTQTELMPL